MPQPITSGISLAQLTVSSGGNHFHRFTDLVCLFRFWGMRLLMRGMTESGVKRENSSQQGAWKRFHASRPTVALPASPRKRRRREP